MLSAFFRLLCSVFFFHSFRAGASGPSQEQVYEAMQIFGEGIQDFDFMKGEDKGGEGGEVRCNDTIQQCCRYIQGIHIMLARVQSLSFPFFLL